MRTIISLDNMLRSIHNAILKTQQLTEEQHIRNLQRYFIEEDGDPKTYRPKTYRVKIPEGQPEPAEHSADDRNEKKETQSREESESAKLTEKDSGGEKETSPAGAGEGKKEDATVIDVPIVALLPHSAIKIKDFRISFKVGVVGYYKPKEGFAIQGEEGQRKHSGPLYVDVGTGSVRSQAKSSADNLAEVTVTFENTDPPEWYLRLGDQVIKSIL